MAAFYKIWKKYNEIQLTKKWTLIEKWKIFHRPPLNVDNIAVAK